MYDWLSVTDLLNRVCPSSRYVVTQSIQIEKNTLSTGKPDQRRAIELSVKFQSVQRQNWGILYGVSFIWVFIIGSVSYKRCLFKGVNYRGVYKSCVFSSWFPL